MNRGHWKKGQTGNPGGKPKDPDVPKTEAGRRELAALKNLIFAHALTRVRTTAVDNLAYGNDATPREERRLILALTRLFREDPKEYLTVIARVLPKDISIEGDFTHHLQSWNSILTYAASQNHQAQVQASAALPRERPQLPVLEAEVLETPKRRVKVKTGKNGTLRHNKR